MQGGPGTSSLLSSLLETGPCLITEANTTACNPESWAESFNMLYVDQPAGVSLSYVHEPSAYPNRTGDAVRDVVSLIELVYEVFPHISKTSLYIAGESFGGEVWPGSCVADP
ncbi:Alpha/Beta hydrolase protein [Microdochium trichocladiopsis]|uniref:Alpha/Beta hydrolase protein n=1 Tax=Microdochium trichocladiopsis TaxID=1682393 RepID=A0A9P8XWV6_9PEZI|nr:Alpha/Beta hydrolase protein [Microdochium trichocladiopsis]KAH7017967.1 Alpha/Beta hydrolase protein [Microdochium trichocladiopsis]